MPVSVCIVTRFDEKLELYSPVSLPSLYTTHLLAQPFRQNLMYIYIFLANYTSTFDSKLL